MGGHLAGTRRAGPFWGRGDPDPGALARIIVGTGCSWAEFLGFDDDLQHAIWRELNGVIVPVAPPVISAVEDEPAASPWPAHFPVVHTGSPEFAALFRQAQEAV